MTALTQQILEQKRQRRQTLAQLSFPEKVRIVEKLRDASKRMAQAGRRQGLPDSHPSICGFPESAAKGSRIGPRLCRRSYDKE